jgi:hypothetical protein
MEGNSETRIGRRPFDRRRARGQRNAEAKQSHPGPTRSGKKEKLMPINLKDYPTNWKRTIRPEVLKRSRNKRGQEQCECRGECDKHPGRRCDEINHTLPKHPLKARKQGKKPFPIILTVSHLCHSKKCPRRAHLRAMCQGCHLLYHACCKARGLWGGSAVRWAMQQSRTA